MQKERNKMSMERKDGKQNLKQMKERRIQGGKHYERETETDRQTDRQRERERDRQTETETCLLYTSDAADES